MEVKITLILTFLFSFLVICTSSGWKPTLLEKSLDRNYYTNVYIRMFCKFNSNPSANVVWTKDGNSIKDSDRIQSGLFIQKDNTTYVYQLKILSCRASDEGNYSCTAQNGFGVAQGTIKIGIIKNYPPRITPMHDVILYRGQKFIAECTSDALPVATHTWQKMSGFIDKSRVKDTGDGQLQFQSIRNADRGKYICTASNSEGESLKSFQIKVVDDPSWISQPVNYTKSYYGRNISITAIFTGSETGLAVAWYKDSEIFTRNKPSKLSSASGAFFRSSLTFPSAELKDNGEYSLVVTNDQGRIHTKAILVVNTKPRVVIREGRNASVYLGDTLILQCTVESVPAPSVFWEFNGSVLAMSDEANKPTSRKAELTVRDAEREDEGDYFCVGKNKEGITKHSVRVSIKDVTVVNTGGAKKDNKSSNLIIIVCVAVIFVIVIILATVFIIHYQRRKPQVRGTVKFDNSSSDKDPELFMLNETQSGSPSGSEEPTVMYEQPLLENQHQPKKTLLSKYRRGTGSKSPSEENILPGHGIPLELLQITCGSELGTDCFACAIFKGEVVIDNEVKVVAIKKLCDKAEERTKFLFSKELETLKKLSHHPNIVALIGWCGSGDDLQIVTEFGIYGSLLNFLRTFKKGLFMKTLKSDVEYNTDFELNEKDLLSFGWQIASGMKYLSSMGIVHKDLAARNVVLGHEHVCKIMNVGMDKEGIYSSTTGGELPLKWMGFESIFKGEFSSKSDVWSFGVVLWEIATLGDYPYPGFSTPDELLEAMKNNYRMDCPVHCSETLYDVMMACWEKSPSHRPDFAKVCIQVGSMLCDIDTHIDFEVLKQSFKESEDLEDNC